MPKETTSAKRATASEAPPNEFQDDALDSLAWMESSWVEAMSDLGLELTNFVADRIREDVKTQHKLLHCKSLTEVQEVQAEFLERAFTQYTVETGKLIEKSSSWFPQVLSKTKGTPV